MWAVQIPTVIARAKAMLRIHKFVFHPINMCASYAQISFHASWHWQRTNTFSFKIIVISLRPCCRFEGDYVPVDS